jgi:hypothetical protein
LMFVVLIFFPFWLIWNSFFALEALLIPICLFYVNFSLVCLILY